MQKKYDSENELARVVLYAVREKSTSLTAASGITSRATSKSATASDATR